MSLQNGYRGQLSLRWAVLLWFKAQAKYIFELLKEVSLSY